MYWGQVYNLQICAKPLPPPPISMQFMAPIMDNPLYCISFTASPWIMVTLCTFCINLMYLQFILMYLQFILRLSFLNESTDSLETSISPIHFQAWLWESDLLPVALSHCDQCSWLQLPSCLHSSCNQLMCSLQNQSMIYIHQPTWATPPGLQGRTKWVTRILMCISEISTWCLHFSDLPFHDWLCAIAISLRWAQWDDLGKKIKPIFWTGVHLYVVESCGNHWATECSVHK